MCGGYKLRGVSCEAAAIGVCSCPVVLSCRGLARDGCTGCGGSIWSAGGSYGCMICGVRTSAGDGGSVRCCGRTVKACSPFASPYSVVASVLSFSKLMPLFRKVAINSRRKG